MYWCIKKDIWKKKNKKEEIKQLTNYNFVNN
jgi:hypothetical protein